MGLHQPTIKYDLPEMNVPAIFTSLHAGQDPNKSLAHAKEFLGRALREQGRHDVEYIVDTVRIVGKVIPKK